MPQKPYRKKRKFTLSSLLSKIPLKVWIIAFFSIVMMASIYWWRTPQEHTITGKTMGTTYTIKLYMYRFAKTTQIQADVDKALQEINDSMSTFKQDSEISNFNRYTDIEKPFPISKVLSDVINQALPIYKLSQGAFDPTIKPLVDLWGFSEHGHYQIPSDNEIVDTLKYVGFDKIIVSGNTLQKKDPDVQLDVSSLAMGYAVDKIGKYLFANRYPRFMVEVGGAVLTSGTRVNGKPWRIGINVPDPDAELTSAIRVYPVSYRALSTSGDYHNFFEKDGVRYCHIINPKTGTPIRNNVTSVTVFAPTAMLADVLDTTLMVLGPEKGLKWIQQFIGVEAMFIVKSEDRQIVYKSPGFPIGKVP